MLDQIPTEGTNHSKAPTDGVRRRPFVPDALTGIPVLSRGSSDMLGGASVCREGRDCSRLARHLERIGGS